MIELDDDLVREYLSLFSSILTPFNLIPFLLVGQIRMKSVGLVGLPVSLFILAISIAAFVVLPQGRSPKRVPGNVIRCASLAIVYGWLAYNFP